MAQAYGFMNTTTKPTQTRAPQGIQRGQQAAQQQPASMGDDRKGRPLMTSTSPYINSLKPNAPQQPGGYNPTPAPGAFNPSFSQESQLQNPGKPIGNGPVGDFARGPGYNSLNDVAYWNDKNTSGARYVENMLPVELARQNAYQYGNDFNEAQRRWDTEMRWNKTTGQFDMGLQTQQQQMAEWQAREAANQWGAQFGHTQNMDIRGAGQRDTELANQYRVGMDQNQAGRDVAGTYAGAQRYGADQQRMADYYQAQQAAQADMYGANQQLAGAGLYSDAQRYQAQQAAQADMYGANQQLAGANVYAGAQRYGSDQQLNQTKYQWDMQNRINQAMMANNLQVANTQAYGRSQAPAANWATNWA